MGSYCSPPFAASLYVFGLDAFHPGLGVAEEVPRLVANAEFPRTLFEGMPGLVLFARALHSRVEDLRVAAGVSSSPQRRRTLQPATRASWIGTALKVAGSREGQGAAGRPHQQRPRYHQREAGARWCSLNTQVRWRLISLRFIGKAKR